MHPAKKYVVLGLCGLLALESSNPHASFVVVSPTIEMTAALTNTTAAAFFSAPGPFKSFTPVEIKIPHDRLVIQTAGLLFPIKQ